MNSTPILCCKSESSLAFKRFSDRTGIRHLWSARAPAKAVARPRLADSIAASALVDSEIEIGQTVVCAILRETTFLASRYCFEKTYYLGLVHLFRLRLDFFLQLFTAQSSIARQDDSGLFTPRIGRPPTVAPRPLHPAAAACAASLTPAGPRATDSDSA